MRDVFFRVIVVLAVMLACITTVSGQTTPTTQLKSNPASAFEQLSQSQYRAYLERFHMDGVIGTLKIIDGHAGILYMAKIDARAMLRITDPAECLAKGKKIITALEKALDLAEKEMQAAEAVAGKARAKTRLKTNKMILAAKAAYTYYEILYFLGDISGRQAVRPYVYRMTHLQDNREDRKIILEQTYDAIMYLGDMQEDLQKMMRAWQGNMAVWMIMGSKGGTLLQEAQFWSTRTYLYRAMALGDAEAHQADKHSPQRLGHERPGPVQEDSPGDEENHGARGGEHVLE